MSRQGGTPASEQHRGNKELQARAVPGPEAQALASHSEIRHLGWSQASANKDPNGAKAKEMPTAYPSHERLNTFTLRKIP